MTWLDTSRLNDPVHLMSEWDREADKLVGDAWLFDGSRVPGTWDPR